MKHSASAYLYLALSILASACTPQNIEKKPDVTQVTAAAFTDVKSRWDQAFSDLNTQLALCDEQKQTNTYNIPDITTLQQQGLTIREFQIGMMLLSQSLYRDCSATAVHKAAYELGVYNHFIRENLLEVTEAGLLPDTEFHSWNDYTGDAEILFEEDLIKMKILSDEVGEFTDQQHAFMRELVKNKPFDSRKILEQLRNTED